MKRRRKNPRDESAEAGFAKDRAAIKRIRGMLYGSTYREAPADVREVERIRRAQASAQRELLDIGTGDKKRSISKFAKRPHPKKRSYTLDQLRQLYVKAKKSKDRAALRKFGIIIHNWKNPQ